MKTKTEHGIADSNAEAVEKLRDLVKDVNVCMFTTIDNEGTVTTRPMTTIDIDDEGNLWFFTNDFGENILDNSYDNSAYLIYSHPGANTYLCVKGISNIIVDKNKIEELWKPMLKAWFPRGVNDPKLCLIKVITEEAKYWNSTSNKMVVFYNMVKAIAKKEKYQEGEMGTLNLTSQE
jgi:general stress protein 26